MKLSASPQKAYLLILLFACICMGRAYAQRYPFYNLNVEHGLIQSQAMSLTQDKLGHLWVGTLGGLSRYDGRGFTNYSVRDGLQNNNVSALAADKFGNIWVGYNGGVSRFDGRDFKHYPIPATGSQLPKIVNSIQIAADGRIWLRSTGRLYYMHRDTVKPYNIPDSGAMVTAMLPEKGNVWVALNNGVVYNYHNKKRDTFRFHEPRFAVAPYVTSIFRDSRNKLWLITNGGLYNIEDDSIRIASVRGAPTYNVPLLYNATEDKNGALWFSANNGAVRLKDSILEYYNKRNGLTDNNINQVLADAEGNVWFASDGQGIYRYSGSLFTVLDEEMGLPSAQIMSIAALRNGRIYLGTYDAGLYAYEGGQIYKTELPFNPTTAITAMKVRNSYEIWLGTRGAGLWKYNGTLFWQYVTPTIPSNLITSLYVDDSNRLWVGTINGASYMKRTTFYGVNIGNTSVQGFISIGADSILIATHSGLKLFHKGTVSSYVTGSAPDSSVPECFTLRGRELWIGTSDNGVIRYHMDTKKSDVINKSNGLQSDFIYNIVDDDQGNIWVGTGYGIHRITMANDTPQISFFGQGQGVTGIESNHNAVLKMPDGSIWFGTTNGALHYSPQASVVRSQPISVVLQSVRIFGESINNTTFYDSLDNWYKVPYKLNLPYQKNNITFTFQAITLSGLEQIRYRYRIEGLDAPWSDWSAVNSVTFSALPPGNYTLIVESTAGDKIGKLEYPFVIATPFHKTSWFRIAIIAASILLGIVIQYLVNLRKQRRLALLERLRTEEQNKVRQRTAEDFHDEVGNRLTRINVLTNVLKNKLGILSPDAKRLIEQIQDNTSQLYSGTRDILWSLKPANDSLREIVLRMRDFGAELFQDTEVEFEFAGNEEQWKNYKLPLDVSRNLIMIFKEAMNNSLKYSGATKIQLEVTMKPHDALQVRLSDNGKGFDLDTMQKGHGLDNMHVRAKRLDGRFYIDTHPGRGTIITLTFRIPPKSRKRR